MSLDSRFTLSDIVIGVSTIFGAVVAFLPWWSGSIGIDEFRESGSISGISEATGVFYFLGALAVAGFLASRTPAALTVKLPALPLKDWLIYLIGGAFMLVMVLFYQVGKPSGSSSEFVEVSVGRSVGFYLALVAAVAVGVGAILKRKMDPQPETAVFNIGRVGANAPPAPTPTHSGPSPSAVKCAGCRAPLAAGTRFCASCGRAVDAMP
jgi:hypothetical protein